MTITFAIEIAQESRNMIFQGTAIPNLIIEVIGIMTCVYALITIWYGPAKYMTTRKYMTVAFGSMFLYNICLLVLEFTQASQTTPPRDVVVLAGFGTYVFPLITAFVIALYVVVQTKPPIEKYMILRPGLQILFFIGFVALLTAQATGNLIIVDQNGQFDYGPASHVGFIAPCIFMIIGLIILIRNGQNITPRQRTAFITYMTLPIVSIFFRGFWPDVYIVALATSLSMLIMLGIVLNDQAAMMRRQELDNEQLKVDLMLSQIQPHFLFNVLYVIQEICLVDAETASQAIADFSRYLRHNMDSITINNPIPFGEELEHVKHYVSLQQLRFGDALDVRYELDCTDFQLPTLTLQPLVENAIRYGIRKSETGTGTVLITTEEYPEHYEIHVIDDGPGFDLNEKPKDGSSHLGLQNVRERLSRISGGELIITSKTGEGSDLTITLPKSRQGGLGGINPDAF